MSDKRPFPGYIKDLTVNGEPVIVGGEQVRSFPWDDETPGIVFDDESIILSSEVHIILSYWRSAKKKRGVE